MLSLCTALQPLKVGGVLCFSASSGSHEEDHGPLQGVKGEGWMQVQGPIKNSAARSIGGNIFHELGDWSG